MIPARPARLRLETFEDRLCPAISIRLVGPDLFITGRPLAGPTSGEQFRIQETAPNRFSVQDVTLSGTKTYGTFPVSRLLSVSLAHYNTNVNVDVNGNTFTGSVMLNLGLGDTNPATVNPVSVFSGVAGGTVRGNVTFLRGSGSEVLNIGQIGTTPVTPAALEVFGSVAAVGRNTQGSPRLFFNAGDTLFVGPGSTVRGNLNTSFIDSVDIGEPTPTDLTTVAGSVNINNATAPNFLGVNVFGVVGRSLTATGTRQGDSFTLAPTAAATGGVINGNLTLNLGTASNIGELVTLAAGATVGGNASIQSLGGPNVGLSGGLYSIDSAISGNLILSLGQGDNLLAFTGSVSGNVSVRADNGDNDLSAFTGTVDGNLVIRLGNGNNTATIANAPGGRLSWVSGNGTDALTLGTGLFNVNILFGTDTNTLDLSAATTLTGVVIGTGGNNTFNQNGATLLPTLVFLSFP
ncbi:MAG: hypothetical protein U0797_03720 [Gemmataceae bacterium]